MSASAHHDIVRLAEEGGVGALVTLVRSYISAPHKPGTRLLIRHDGRFAGTVSAEDWDVGLLHKTIERSRNGALTELFDDGAKNPYGLVCSGEIDLLLEPAGTDEFAALLEAMRASLRGEQMLVATALPEGQCTFGRIVVHERGDVVFASEHFATDDIVDLRAYLRKNFAAPDSVAAAAYRSFFFERIAPV